MSLKIYVAGPMTPTRFDEAEETDHTYKHFHDAAAELKAAGHLVYNPASNEIPVKARDSSGRLGVVYDLYKQDPTYTPLTSEQWSSMKGAEYTKAYREVMERDLRWIMECDAVALLPGWRKSNGAMFEHFVAAFLHKRISNVKEFVEEGKREQDEIADARKAIREYAMGGPVRTPSIYYRANALSRVQQELIRVDELWGIQNHHPLQWHAILVEEVGEVAKELADARIKEFDRDHYEDELVQTAAMAIRALETSERESRGNVPAATSIEGFGTV